MSLAFSAPLPITHSSLRPRYCSRCVRSTLRVRPLRTARRPRAALTSPADVTSENGTPRSKSSSEHVNDSNANSVALDALLPHQSVSEARSSLRALIKTYLRLAAAEPFIVRRLVLAVICVIISKLLALLVPLQFKRSVDALSGAATERAGGTVALRAFASAIALHFVATIGASMTRELRNGVFSRAGQRIGRRVTATAFAHILRQDAAFHAASATGTLTRIVDRGTRSVMTVFRGLIFSFGPTLLELLLVCTVLWRAFSAWYAIVTLATFAIYLAFTFRLNDAMSLVRLEMNLVENESGAKLADAFFNVDSVTAFDNFNFESKRFDATLRRAEELAVRNEWLYVFLNFGQGAIFTTGLVAMLWRSGTSIIAGSMSVGSFVMLYSMLQQLWVPLNFLGWQYREVRQSLIDLQNLFAILERQSIVREIEGAQPLIVKGGGVEFRNVSFSYPKEEDLDMDFIKKRSEGAKFSDAHADGEDIEKRRQAIKNLSFKVEPGQSLALVGPSGSGKSSTLKLLYRLFDVSDGNILIDGQDISQVSLSSLREAVSIVPQDTALFNDTIAYNIRYGRPSATDDEVVAAAKAASIHDTIMRTPQAYETLVGERGVRLSGGERQRLSVARAFLKNSRIIMEDESTSSLDSAMEMEVTKALKELGLNRTRIVIAHRLSTVSDADLIIVIRDGEKVEEGTHEELLSNAGGLYRELWQRQQDRRFEEGTQTTVEERKQSILPQRKEIGLSLDDPLPRPQAPGDSLH